MEVVASFDGGWRESEVERERDNEEERKTAIDEETERETVRKREKGRVKWIKK